VYRARTVPDMLNPPKPIITNQPWETFFGGKVTVPAEKPDHRMDADSAIATVMIG
jgi:hypothetical protein